MLFRLPLLILTASAAVLQPQTPPRQTLSGSTVCSQIASSITDQVYYPVDLSGHFASDTSHYMTSSSQTPTCVVEVATPQDVAHVLKIVGPSRIPFAVKSGGHASNPGFSSTDGVFVSLVRMKGVTLSGDRKTVEVGTGNLWADVYAALQGSGVNVVGGRVVGPGVGGFTLGGGYSWLTNQYGLTCDTVKAYNVVPPNGTITQVDSSNPHLFFALKGGLNRFGVMTSIIFNTVPQTNNVYGGIKVFGNDAVPALIEATNTFQNAVTDPKAQVILTINGGTAPGAIVLLFYDGPESPAAFEQYNNISGALISTVKSQDYASFSTGTPSNIQAGHRGAFYTMMTTGLTTGFMNAVHNESTYYGTLALLHGGSLLSYDLEPLLNYGQYATDSAFPHANSPLPLNLYFAWDLEANDAFWRGVMQQSIDYLTEVAKAEGIFTEGAYAYPNYALDTYDGSQLYGPTNAARLREIQDTYDPNGVMRLAGGFTF